MTSPLVAFVRQRRKLLHLSQPDLAAKAGVGLRFVRELEQGKAMLRIVADVRAGLRPCARV